MSAAADRTPLLRLRALIELDPRSLGLLRICLALLLLYDLATRVFTFDVWYAETGLFPKSVMLAEAERLGMRSVLWHLSSDTAAWVAFAVFGLAYLGLLVGYATKLCQLVSLVGVISLQARVNGLSNGGDFVLCALSWWMLFLPLGRRLSLDRWLARRTNTGSSEHVEPSVTEPVVSLAVLAALLQLAVIYFFNAVHKDGPAWREGSAIHYFVQQERILKPPGLWAREHLPYGVMRAMSYLALGLELALPIFILSPVRTAMFRRAAVIGIFSLHAGIATIADFGVFSMVMCVFGTMLIPSEDWDAFERWRATRRGAAPTREPKATAPLSAWRARLVWPVRLGHRLRAGRLRRPVLLLREAAVVALVLLAGAQVLHENRKIPAPIKITKLPKPIDEAIWTTRLKQGWGMFSPDPPKDEVTLIVTGTTVDGRSVSPLFGFGREPSIEELTRVPVQQALVERGRTYVMRAANNRTWLRQLGRHLDERHLITGRPEDELASYVVWEIKQQSPAPRKKEPTHVRTRRVIVRTPGAPHRLMR